MKKTIKKINCKLAWITYDVYDDNNHHDDNVDDVVDDDHDVDVDGGSWCM